MATLKFQKGAFGHLTIPVFLKLCTPKLVCGLQHRQKGHVSFMVTSNFHQKKSYGNLKVEKRGFGSLAPSVFNSAPGLGSNPLKDLNQVILSDWVKSKSFYFLMVTSNSQQKNSYGHLKVQKWAFGNPQLHSVFNSAPPKLV